MSARHIIEKRVSKIPIPYTFNMGRKNHNCGYGTEGIKIFNANLFHLSQKLIQLFFSQNVQLLRISKALTGYRIAVL